MDGKDELLGREEQTRAQERRAAVEDKLRHDVREMLEVLKADIPGFFAREAKRRFLGAPQFAERLTEEQVGRLKRQVQDAGDLTAADVVRALEDSKAWTWDANAPFP